MTVAYPNFPGKHAEEALFGPTDFLAYQRRVGALAEYEPPAGIVLCYQRSLLEHALDAEGIEPSRHHGWKGMRLLPSTGGKVGILGGFGIGAPAAAAALEELAALGTRRFVSVGTAGGLQPGLAVGDLVVCQAAIRDEGVSHHYLPAAKLASPSAGLTGELQRALTAAEAAFTSGTSWTIDTPYRETVAEARHYQGEGVLCVEMEAAALFAVGSVREVQVASAFAISDSLAGLEWDPQFHAADVAASLETLYRAALAVLAG